MPKFNAAKIARQKYPLAKDSQFKLHEVRAHIARWQASLASIKSNPQNVYHGCCTKEDAKQWAKNLPDVIVHSLGYDFVPAYEATNGIKPDASKIANTVNLASIAQNSRNLDDLMAAVQAYADLPN